MEAAGSPVGAVEKFSATGYKLYGSGKWGVHSSVGSYRWLEDMKFPCSTPKGFLFSFHKYLTLLYLVNENNFY